MESHASIGFIFFAIGGLLGQQVVQQHCDENYCYRNDGELKNVTSLKDAQDYCYNNDSASWLLEIYDFQQLKNFFRRNYPKRPFLLNSIGTVANEWKGVTNGQLPSDLIIDESHGQDFLYLNISGGQVYFHGAHKKSWGSYICRVPGNCPDGYCYEIHFASIYWFASELLCFTNRTTVNKDYGHLATFERMSYDQISNLSFVERLTENEIYWIGYSKLVYTWQHSKVRNYILPLSSNQYLTATHPNESYFVYVENNVFTEKPVGFGQFEIICMLAKTTAEQTSTTAMTTSASSGQTSVTVHPTSALKTTTTSFESTIAPISATTGQTSVAIHPTSALKTTTASFEPTIAPISESTAILTLILPILLWLVFSISFICCILPFCSF